MKRRRGYGRGYGGYGGYALLLVALLVSGTVGYVVRRLRRGSGATDAEQQAGLPFDTVIPQPSVQTTHAVTIRAPAAAVWPWLVQMGYGRAGWYTNVWWYRLVDRYLWHVADMPRVDRLLPEFQQLAQGDVIPDGPPGTAYWTVVGLEPERSLALFSTTHGTVWLPRVVRDNPRLGIHAELGWVFVLREPGPGQTGQTGQTGQSGQTGETRLMLRSRAIATPALYRLLASALLPLGDFVMARMLLRTIKRNVERTPPMLAPSPNQTPNQTPGAATPAPLSEGTR